VRLIELEQTVFDEGVPIPATVAVRIVLDAARATWKAHRLAAEVGLFPSERLFLPEGVLLAGYGGVLLTEVGVLSALARCVIPRTVPDLLAQLAPEELGSSTAQAGSPEVFSLGVVLWELLANRWLFSRDSDSRTHQELLLSQIPGLDQIERFGMPVPKTIVDLVSKATERDPAKRFASVNEFVLALESLPAHFVASEQQLSEVLRQRAHSWLDASRVEESTSGTFAEVHSSQPSIPPPSLSSGHDWDRPTFAQRSLIGAPLQTEVSPPRSVAEPLQAPVVTESIQPQPRPRRGRPGLWSLTVVAMAVGAFILTFQQIPRPHALTKSPAPAAAMAPRSPTKVPKVTGATQATPAQLDAVASATPIALGTEGDTADAPPPSVATATPSAGEAKSVPQTLPVMQPRAARPTSSKRVLPLKHPSSPSESDTSPPEPASPAPAHPTSTLDPQWGI
jgi:hypothetical protein